MDKYWQNNFQNRATLTNGKESITVYGKAAVLVDTITITTALLVGIVLVSKVLKM